MAGAPPQALGPRPGSRSLAADTVCFPGDAHPVTGHFSWYPLPQGPAQGSRVLGCTEYQQGQDWPSASEGMTRWKASLTFAYGPEKGCPRRPTVLPMPHRLAQRRLGQLKQLRVLSAWCDCTQPVRGRAMGSSREEESGEVLATGDGLYLQPPSLILSLFPGLRPTPDP